jgi:ribosomal protein S18 acetylase RimI-like enzyme
LSDGVTVRILESADAELLASSDGVFDDPVQPDMAARFLEDPGHHIVAAIVAGRVVGFVSAVRYLHPDKDPQLWINELGVHLKHRRKGIGRALVRAMLEHGEALGCVEAWVLTEGENKAAMRLYASAAGLRAAGDVAMFEWRLSRREPGAEVRSSPR